QLSARVTNDEPAVTWKASAGSITTAGLYTAPSEPPAGGKVTVSATSSKGAVGSVSIEITPAATSKVLLAGDATSTYTAGDQTAAGHEEGFQFTAKSSGTVEELQFRTNGASNAGITGLSLGIFAENAGTPGEQLGGATASGEPPPNSWIKVSGVSIPVVAGTKYWLVALPLGSGQSLHYNVAATVGAGAGNLESLAGGLTALTAEASWEAYNQGPVGFQALGRLSAAANAVRASAATGATGKPRGSAVAAVAATPRSV